MDYKNEQIESSEQSFKIYHNDRKNSFIIVNEQEMDGEKELDMLLHGYSTLETNIQSFEEGEKYISDYLYQKYANFHLQKGYKRLSSKRVRSYE